MVSIMIEDKRKVELLKTISNHKFTLMNYKDNYKQALIHHYGQHKEKPSKVRHSTYKVKPITILKKLVD